MDAHKNSGFKIHPVFQLHSAHIFYFKYTKQHIKVAAHHSTKKAKSTSLGLF